MLSSLIKRGHLHNLLGLSAVIQALGLVLVLLLGIQLARLLGPEKYGAYGLIMSIVSLVVVIGEFGLSLLATREAARAISAASRVNIREVARWFFFRALRFSILAGTTLALLWFLLDPWNGVGRVAVIVLTSITVVMFSVLTVSAAILRGAGGNLSSQVVEILLRPAIIVASIFAIYIFAGGVSVEGALSVQVWAALICLFAVGYLFNIIAPRPSDGLESYSIKPWVRTAGSLMLNRLLGVMNGNYPMIVASAFVLSHDLGVLRVALSSAALLSLPSSIANITAVPLIAKYDADANPSALADTLSHTTIAGFFLTAGSWVFLLIFGEPLLELLFGADYRQAHLPMIVTGLGQVVISSFGVSGSYLNLTGREGLVTRAFIVSVPLGIAASIALTAVIGISGAAAGSAVMALAWHVYVFGLNRPETQLPISLISALRHVALSRGKRS